MIKGAIVFYKDRSQGVRKDPPPLLTVAMSDNAAR